MTDPSRSTHPGPRRPGRRAAEVPRGGLSLTVVLALVLPLLTVGAMLLPGAPVDEEVAHPPDDVPLSRQTMVCPAPEGQGSLGVASADPRASGRVRQTVPVREPLALRSGRAAAPEGAAADGPVAVVAEGDLAPGLLAGRWDEAGATACVRPEPDAWFTGLAAGPERSSVLRLVNPDIGPAVADVTVLTPDGPVESSRLRGVRVGGRSSLTLDLGEIVPTRADLAVHVEVDRGRLGADAVDVTEPVGRGPTLTTRVHSQPEPREQSWLLGLRTDDQQPVLHVANPGEDAARVAVRVVTGRSEFVPAGLEEVRVEAGSVATVPLTDVLRGGPGAGASGLRLDASAPVTATVRGTRGGDGVSQVAAPPVEELTGAVLPEGPKQLVLAGAEVPGTARISLRDAAGEVVEQRTVEVDPGRSASVDLPAAGRVLVVRPAKTALAAAVVVEQPAAGVVPLAEVPLTGLSADVRPAVD